MSTAFIFALEDGSSSLTSRPISRDLHASSDKHTVVFSNPSAMLAATQLLGTAFLDCDIDCGADNYARTTILCLAP